MNTLSVCVVVGLTLFARSSVDMSIVSQGEYTGEIKGGLRPSMKLVVMGIINKKPKR